VAEKPLEERTEEPTPKRRREAREKGQVAKSPELNSVAVLLAGLLALRFAGTAMLGRLERTAVRTFSGEVWADLSANGLRTVAGDTLLTLGAIVAPIMVAVACGGLLSNVGQVGFLLTGEPLVPKPERLNPAEGAKRVLSRKSAIRLAISVGKILVIGSIAFTTVRSRADEFLPLTLAQPRVLFGFVTHVVFLLGIRVCLALLVLAAIDYAYQKYEFEKNLRMTKQELKEEMKQLEGDPLIKARVRSIQRQMAMERMMAEVPEADVVVTNPTHLAVALRYDTSMDSAPRVVAKGARLLAERIRSIAGEHNVPIVENKPLARSLYRACEVGDIVPASLYDAVAEVLAYVYGLRRSAAVA